MKSEKRKKIEEKVKTPVVVTYGDVLNIRDGLAAIRNGKGSIKTAVEVGYVTKTLSSVLDPVAEQMQALIDKHADKDNKGKVINTRPGRVTIPDPKKFMKEQEKFLALEIELPGVKPLKYDDLEDMDLRISEQMLSAMKKGKIIVGIPSFDEDEKPDLKLEPSEEE